MAGCGYVCPVCEGKGFSEEGAPCSYCQTPKTPIQTLDLKEEKDSSSDTKLDRPEA